MSSREKSAGVTRRHFLTTAGMTAVGAAAHAQSPSPPVNLRVSSAVLQPSDFTYKGMFDVGSDTWFGGVLQRKGYSRGNLTGRRVNGQLRLLVTGSHADEWRSPIYEMTPPPEASWVQRYDQTPPSMSIVKDWSGGVRGLGAPLYPNGQPVYDRNGQTVKGLLWDPVLNGVWYSYLAVYNVGPTHDPSIGFIHIDDATGVATGYGPWRHRQISPRTGGYGLYIPDDWKNLFGNRNLAFGAETATRGVLGMSLHPTARPVNFKTLPFDPSADVYNVTVGPGSSQPHWSLDGSPALMNGYGQDMLRPANFINCGWKTDAYPRTYPTDPNNPATSYVPPADASGRCKMDAIDSVCASAFIDTGTRRGIVMFGIMVWPSDDYATPHSWYGPSSNLVGDPSKAVCGHGHVAPTGNSGTGYYASGLAPYWWIYDPADVAAGFNGQIQPHQVVPKHAFAAREMHGAANAPHFKRPTRWYCTGAYYDPVDRNLYLSEDGGRTGAGEARAMIHVFRVTG
jgi:hypothetical protein